MQRSVLDSALSSYRTYPDAYSSLALAAMPSVLALYGRNVSAGNRPAISRAFSDLQGPLAHPTFGLLFAPPQPLWPPTRADARLNAYAAWLVAALPPPEGDSELAAQWAALGAAAGGWRRAAARQLVLDANEARAGYPPR